MKAVLSFCTLLLARASLAAPPTVTRGNGSITVANADYTAIISEANGSLSRLEARAFGPATCIAGGMTYADIGVLGPSRHPFLGTPPATGAAVTVTNEGGQVIVAAEGALALEGGKPPSGVKWRYRFRYTFGESPVVHVVAGVQTDTARPAAGGFLATALNVSGVREWFADTEKGMQWVDLGTENARCFEARRTPLRDDHRRIGLINDRNGAVVLFDHIRAEPAGALEDVLFHSGGTGSVTAFFAWLDGTSQTVFEPGKWCELAFDVSITGRLPE